MAITQVHYQKLVSLGNYENERIGAWATVEEGQTPEEALTGLQTWVAEQVGDREHEETLTRRINGLEGTRLQLEREISGMRETWTKARAFLSAVGLELPRSYVQNDDTDMPF